MNEYIINCVECLRLLVYNEFKLNGGKKDSTDEKKSTISIGLAVLKSSSSATNSDDENNLLIKRFTLQVEHVLLNVLKKSDDLDEDWYFRDCILKCLYSKEAQYPANFKWQIQLRTGLGQMKQMSSAEDLFKLFSWRECDRKELNDDETLLNRLNIKPIKTMNHLINYNIRIQFFVEEEDSKAAASRKKYTRLFRKSKNRKSLEQDNDDYDDEDFATTDSDNDDPNASAQDTTFDSSFKKFKSK